MKGLYIHIPFCDHICVYCDFLKFIAKESLQKQYIIALCKEINLKIDNNQLSDIDTIYIGGGTPSCLPLNLLSELLTTIDRICSINNIKEYTIEANPIDIYNKKEELLKLFINHHINRLSLGVQSFNDAKLKSMVRNHSKKIAIDAIKYAKQYIDNVSIDLIFGFEKDTFPLIRKDIDYAKELDVKHISCYSLILEDKSILKHKVDLGTFNLMNPEKESRMYYKITQYLNINGYNQYEISNFSSNKFESIHNKKYWNSELYEACGIGSASYVLNNNEYHRIKNITKINDYIKILSKEHANLKDLILEDIIYNKNDIMDMEIDLSLRLTKGINKDKFYNLYNENIKKIYPNIQKLINLGFLNENKDNIYIPNNKIYLHTAIVEKIID